MRFSLWNVLAAAPGVALGLALYTFGYARGYSYLLDDSAACANCHVMREQYESWLKSSHHDVASCNDCHTPPGTLGKYATKALNGFNHSLAFTTGRFAEPIRANALNQRIARQACSKCHASIVESMHASSPNERDLADCKRCHGSVGHPD
ncbi:MAG: cytochrome c nitrite reductase small subunit [Polyangiaceae bacterium]|nr:cytochrome c nitrite reductase small subunit [Polyangiaceae bacterium]MBK9002214.1 cytochrome c nitrite reductase small subunit [Myxococcales bacterium]MCE7891074.1 cytochrome c nitrite reductase small subunit [Sorangiineae bacterium PRO1]MCL4751911.1 cytochrome c nitrite reductase small subunit [Myxococcales bacterium]